MSVEMQLENLKIEREALLKGSAEICKQLTEMEGQLTSLKAEEETLQSKTSNLAQQIRQQVKTQIKELEKQIKFIRRQREERDAKISENARLIAEREDKPICYIDEQVGWIIAELLAYVQTHKVSIGRDLKREFFIRAIKAEKKDRYGNYEVPTGDIGIYDEKDRRIIKSSGFYFKQELYHLSRDPNLDYVVVHRTQWYQDYVKTFVETLLIALEARYRGNDDLKLTIGESGFTLELV